MTSMNSTPNFDFLFVFKVTACWQLLYSVLGLLFSRSKHNKIKRFGSSYGVALLHASMMAMVGVWGTLAMLQAPKEVRAFVVWDESSAFYRETQVIQTAAYVFISWLLFDLSHIVLSFPSLGGIDQVLHHVGFLVLTYFCVFYGICPYAGTWLFCGELSTVPLNLRWFLIQSGQGDSYMMKVTNIVFAALFFLTRVALYWSGLLEFISSTLPLLFAHGIPSSVITLFGLLIPGGAFLNAYWFTSILNIARGGGKRKKKHASNSESSIPQEASLETKQD